MAISIIFACHALFCWFRSRTLYFPLTAIPPRPKGILLNVSHYHSDFWPVAFLFRHDAGNRYGAGRDCAWHRCHCLNRNPLGKGSNHHVSESPHPLVAGHPLSRGILECPSYWRFRHAQPCHERPNTRSGVTCDPEADRPIGLLMT